MASDRGLIGHRWITILDIQYVAVRFVCATSMSLQDMFIICECIRGGKATDISVFFVIVG